MTQLKTGLVCIATSGNTVDGRYISPKELEEMAQTYDPSYYTALIWYEHSRNGANLGKVLSLTTVKNGNEVKLFAILSPNAFLVELNSKKQKLFTSIEIVPNFANTGKYYLGGLAVTDSPASVGTTIHAFAKSEAERDNSNRYTANNSTPLTRAFFIRCTRTSKENALGVLLSMVACSGKGFALCCVPCIAVCHPVARYRPITVTSEAIAPINFYTELSAMIYKFLLLGKNRLTIRIRANSEAEARQRLQLSNNTLCIARFNDNLTACNQVKGGIDA